jgi:hypothetical protein
MQAVTFRLICDRVVPILQKSTEDNIRQLLERMPPSKQSIFLSNKRGHPFEKFTEKAIPVPMLAAQAFNCS